MEVLMYHQEGRSYMCLICWKEIETVPDQSSPGNIEKLNRIFQVFTNYMKWENAAGGNAFQFKTELFPFCQNCTPVLSRICELDAQVQELLKEIQGLTANVSGRILLSEGRKKSLEVKEEVEENAEVPGVPEGFSRLAKPYQYDVKKVSSLRDKTVRRFVPAVSVPVVPETVIRKIEERQRASWREGFSSGSGSGRRGRKKGETPKRRGGLKGRKDSKVPEGRRGESSINVPDIGPDGFEPFENDFHDDGNDGEDLWDPKDEQNQRSKSKSEERGRRQRPKQQQHNRLVRTSQDLYIYADKYEVRRLSQNQFQCSECKFISSTLYTSGRHAYFHFCKESNRYKCEECGKPFGRKNDLDKHLLTHLKEKPFKCAFCEDEFPSKRSRWLHMKKLHAENHEPVLEKEHSPMSVLKDNEINPVLAEVVSDNRLEPVVEGVGGNEMPAFEGPIGNIEKEIDASGSPGLIAGRKRKRTKPRHQYRIIQVGEDLYSYADKYQVRKLSEDKFECLECGIVVKSLYLAGRHTYFHYCKDSGRYKCGECGKAFSRKENLSHHLWTHSKEKPKCVICGKAFSRDSLIRQHMKKSHSDHLTLEKAEKGKSSSYTLKSGSATLGNTLEAGVNSVFDVTPSVSSESTDIKKVPTADKDSSGQEKLKEFKRGLAVKRNVAGWNPTKKKPRFNRKLVETSPNLFVYADKYKIRKLSDTQFQCLECTVSMPTRAAASRHAYDHYCKGSNRHKCSTCGKSFARKDSLTTHLMFHTNEKPFKCELCGKGFTKRNPMEFHMSKRKCIKPMSVQGNNSEIDASFVPVLENENSDLNVGETVEVVAGEPSDAVGSPAHLEPGEEIENRDAAKEVVEDSSVKTPRKKRTKSKKAVKPKSRSKKKKKPKVEKSKRVYAFVPVGDEGLLEYRGRYKVKKVSEDWYECLECSRTCSSKGSIYKHVYFHYCVDSSRYKCEECGRVFSRKDDLEQHLRTHRGEKACVCEYCGMAYSKEATLRRHLQRHHSENPEESFKPKPKDVVCEYCGKGFVSQSMLSRHVTVHTGVIFKPVTCDLCGISVSKYRMKCHLRTHATPQYPCPQCNKSLTTPRSLEYHLKSHQKLKPFSCDVCGKKFSRKASVAYHKNSYHSERSAEIHKKRKLPPRGSGIYPCDQCGKLFYRMDSIPYHKKRYHSELTAELDRQLKEKLSRRRTNIDKNEKNVKSRISRISEEEEDEEEDEF